LRRRTITQGYAAFADGQHLDYKAFPSLGIKLTARMFLFIQKVPFFQMP
jgi:hypothetical protein